MITAALYVDGKHLADGSAGDAADEPTALTGLTISWGRSTTIDQPEPSTCSFDVVDRAGGGSFLGLLYVGAQVRVIAAADVAPPAALPGNLDPSFEAADLATVLPWLITGQAGARAIVVDESLAGFPPHSGAHQVVLQNAGQARVHIPPAPIAADVAAWDDLPTLAAGQTWTGSAALVPPPGVQVQVRAGLYRNAADRSPVPAGPAVTVTGGLARAWQTVDIVLAGTADTAGRWVGLYLQVAVPSWTTFPATAWQDLDPAWTWTNMGQLLIDDVTILAPEPGLVRREVVVFDGRASEVNAGWDDGVGGVRCTVVAVDFTADLANRDVGDIPWPAETVAARFAHIMGSAGLTIPYTIDPALATQQVSWLDVDRQQVLPLLTDIATTVDGVLWSAAHRTTGPYLYLADPAARSALYQLDLVDGVVVIIPAAAVADAITLDAADVIRDQVTFRQAVDDVITRAAVTWQEQTTDDQGRPAPTDRLETVVDPALETELGTRRLGISSQLTTAVAAQSLAGRVLARLHSQSWRVGGLTWATWLSEMTTDRTGRALDLLDGTRRLAAPIVLTNLPDWSPAGDTVPLFLQGGTYTFDWGAWSLDLTTASAQSQGTSLAWRDLPDDYTWAAFDPAIAWNDLYGVTAPTEGP